MLRLTGGSVLQRARYIGPKNTTEVVRKPTRTASRILKYAKTDCTNWIVQLQLYGAAILNNHPRK